MRRSLVIFGTLLLLWTMVSQANHALGPYHVYLWVGGLFITYGAITLPLRGGLAASVLAGWLCDAMVPASFGGAHLLLFATAHVIIFNLRDRIPREETAAQVVIALLANLAMFLVFSFVEVSRLPDPAATWPRIIVDLICSQLAIALIAPWVFALQDRALALARPLTESYPRFE